MWLPRPITTRLPMSTTGSASICWPGAIPADRLTHGPIMLRSPIRIHRSL
jgi:hypothetical protein